MLMNNNSDLDEDILRPTNLDLAHLPDPYKGDSDSEDDDEPRPYHLPSHIIFFLSYRILRAGQTHEVEGLASVAIRRLRRIHRILHSDFRNTATRLPSFIPRILIFAISRGCLILSQAIHDLCTYQRTSNLVDPCLLHDVLAYCRATIYIRTFALDTCATSLPRCEAIILHDHSVSIHDYLQPLIDNDVIDERYAIRFRPPNLFRQASWFFEPSHELPAHIHVHQL